jgi:hypothetical protein
VAPDDPEAVAKGLSAALAARGDDALRDRLARAAAELSWDHERLRLLELYSTFAPVDGRR